MLKKIKNFFAETRQLRLEILVSETDETKEITSEGKDTILETALSAEINFRAVLAGVLG